MKTSLSILHEWYLDGARTFNDVRERMNIQEGREFTIEKVAAFLQSRIPQEQWYQSKIISAIKAYYPDAFVRKISAGVYAERGFPDVLVIVKGRYFGIEVKRPFLGKPSPLQLATIDSIIKAGGVAGIACLPVEAIDIIANGLTGK
ncbi:MAG: hypothetical protein ACI4JC_01160 [Faecalibacterium sp.]